VTLIYVIVAAVKSRKGVDAQTTINLAKMVSDTTINALQIARENKVLPQSAADTLTKIANAASITVGNAEQLCKIKQLKPEERKSAAWDYVYNALPLIGVTVSPGLDDAINGAIEAAVMALGHGGKADDEGTDLTAEQAAEITKGR